MANEVLVKVGGTQFLFADHATDFGAAPTTAANSLLAGTQTDVQLDLTGVAASGGARHSAKMDFGATRARAYELLACIEFESAPADGGQVNFYWAPSPSGTAGTGNTGIVTGSDAAFTDTSGNLGELVFIGSLSVVNAVVSIGYVGVLYPTNRYGSLAVVNQASTAMRSSSVAMDETHIVLTPIVDEVQ